MKATYIKSAVFNFLYLNIETVDLIVIAQMCHRFLVYNVEFQFQKRFWLFSIHECVLLI